MTIDEAIAEEKNKAENASVTLKGLNNVDKYINRCNQLVEWLEELKCYRNENNFSEYADRLYKQSYNKALDDFRKKANDYLDESSDFADFVITDNAIDCICDKLRKE